MAPWLLMYGFEDSKKLQRRKKMRVFKTVLTVLALTVGIAGRAKSESMDKDIVHVAASAGSFKTLIAAVQAAGLVDALKGRVH